MSRLCYLHVLHYCLHVQVVVTVAQRVAVRSGPPFRSDPVRAAACGQRAHRVPGGFGPHKSDPEPRSEGHRRRALRGAPHHRVVTDPMRVRRGAHMNAGCCWVVEKGVEWREME